MPTKNVSRWEKERPNKETIIAWLKTKGTKPACWPSCTDASLAGGAAAWARAGSPLINVSRGGTYWTLLTSSRFLNGYTYKWKWDIQARRGINKASVGCDFSPPNWLIFTGASSYLRLSVRILDHSHEYGWADIRRNDVFAFSTSSNALSLDRLWFLWFGDLEF